MILFQSSPLKISQMTLSLATKKFNFGLFEAFEALVIQNPTDHVNDKTIGATGFPWELATQVTL
jgi:hypothetical protein